MSIKKYWTGRHDKGAVSLEFALTFPVVLMVLLAFFDITRIHLQYGVLEHANRRALRSLLVEDWQNQTLSSGRVQSMINDNSYGLLEDVSVSLTRYDSLEALLSSRELSSGELGSEEDDDSGVTRPSDPVYSVTATLTTRLEYSGLAIFFPEPLTFSSTLLLSQQLLFD